MHPGIHVAAVSLFSTTRFPLSVDPNDKFASSHFSNYAFIFPRVVKRFRTISFSKRWLEERGKSRKSRSILIIPLFSLANPSVVNCHVNNDASSSRVSPVFFVWTWGGVTRAIDRQNYATPGTLVSVKSSERAAP